MAITHTGRLNDQPLPVGRIGFAQREANRVGVTVDHLLRFHHIVACKCGAPACPGWRAVYKVTGRGRGEA